MFMYVCSTILGNFFRGGGGGRKCPSPHALIPNLPNVFSVYIPCIPSPVFGFMCLVYSEKHN